MWGKIAVRLVGFAFARADLTIEDRNRLVVHILDNVQAPIRDTIYTDNEGNLIVNGRSLNIEEMKQLREHARSALDNKALLLIRQQVMYEAFLIAIASKARNDLDLYFSRAAVWWGNAVEQKLNILAQRNPEPGDLQD